MPNEPFFGANKMQINAHFSWVKDLKRTNT